MGKVGRFSGGEDRIPFTVQTMTDELPTQPARSCKGRDYTFLRGEYLGVWGGWDRFR